MCHYIIEEVSSKKYTFAGSSPISIGNVVVPFSRMNKAFENIII